MPMRLASLAAAALAAAALAALPASASAASPWWQVLSGARPTHLWEPQTQVQEVHAPVSGVPTVLRIDGKIVACMGNSICSAFGGLSETAAELQSKLEAAKAYGPGGVVVNEEPPASRRFHVTSAGPMAGRWVQPLQAEGAGSAELLSEGGSGRLVLTLTNLGDAPLDATSTPLTITDQMPAGISAYDAQAEAGRQGTAGPVDCEAPSTSLLTCSFEGELPSYEAIEIEVQVSVDPEAVGAPGEVSVFGGDGPSASAPQAIRVSEDPVPFGIEHFSMRAEQRGGGHSSQAGAHPFQATSTFQFNSGRQSGADRRGARVAQPALPRNTRVTFPAGLVGSATAVPTCPLADFLAKTGQFTNGCPDESAVGVASVTIIESANFGLVRLPWPIFNLPPQHGEPARFGFLAAGVPVLIDTAVDPENDYRITGEVRNAPQIASVLAATLSLWGVPGAPRHDASRGWNCVLQGETGPCVPPADRRQIPFLRMPVSCDRPLEFLAGLEPWNVPRGSHVVGASSLSDPLLGCNKTPFDPTLSLAPTGKLAESPSGLEVKLTMPNSGLANPAEGAISETQFKKIEVTLPEGMTVNPSQAEGLATCSPGEYRRERFDSGPGEGCPEASKIGGVKISTPLLAEQAEGSLYIATPHENPFDSLIAIYLVARIPERGVLVKQAGKVEPHPRTGQLVSTFDDVPQLPFSSFELRFREGGRAPLVTPPRCGEFRSVARFVPWSAHDPDNPLPGEIVERTSTFKIERGVDGGPCPQGGAPFAPGFEAGSLNNAAGLFSPFTMRLTRRDGNQDLVRFDAKLPRGVLAKLAGVEKCSDAAIASIAAKTGKAELANPSCPANSKIGAVQAGAGVGSQLTYVPGSVYLAGPFGGAPLSVVGVVPAVAGPFDVGVVSTRQALTLDPITAEVKVDGTLSEPIPHILAGIPLKVRDIQVNVDRPQFTLNPTNCEPMAVGASIWGGGADPFSLLDDSPVARSVRYQAANCASLGFKPRFGIQLRGGTRRGAHPALRAHVRPRPGQANFSRAVVTLPRSAFLDQGNIRTICTRAQFAAGAGHGSSCPPGARYGFARAWSPLLDEPLVGPVFLRSSNNNLPDLVVALRGLVDIELSARIDSVRGGIRSTFTGIPDAPVSRFILDMQGGKKGLIVNSRNLCHKPKRNRAKANLRGQNGRFSRTRPAVRPVNCKRQRKGKGGKSTARLHRMKPAGRG